MIIRRRRRRRKFFTMMKTTVGFNFKFWYKIVLKEKLEEFEEFKCNSSFYFVIYFLATAFSCLTSIFKVCNEKKLLGTFLNLKTPNPKKLLSFNQLFCVFLHAIVFCLLFKHFSFLLLSLHLQKTKKRNHHKKRHE